MAPLAVSDDAAMGAEVALNVGTGVRNVAVRDRQRFLRRAVADGAVESSLARKGSIITCLDGPGARRLDGSTELAKVWHNRARVLWRPLPPPAAREARRCPHPAGSQRPSA